MNRTCRICEFPIGPTDDVLKNVVTTKAGELHRICAENAPRILRELGWKP